MTTEELLAKIDVLEKQNKQMLDAFQLVLTWIQDNIKPNESRKYSRCPICKTSWWDKKEMHTISCWIPDFNHTIQSITGKKPEEA
jgi:hypothetical protein